MSPTSVKHSSRPLRGLIFLQYFNKNWIFLTRFYKGPHYKNFTAIHPVGAALINADILTDERDEGNSFLRLYESAKK